MIEEYYWIIVPILGIIIGALCGLIPLYIGKKFNNKSLGKRGFVCCLISGTIAGVYLALPVSLIFTVIIYRFANNK